MWIHSHQRNCVIRPYTIFYTFWVCHTHACCLPIDLFENKKNMVHLQKDTTWNSKFRLISNIASKQLGFFNEKIMSHHVRKFYEHFMNLKVWFFVTKFQRNEDVFNHDVDKQAPSTLGLLLCAKRNKHHQSS